MRTLVIGGTVFVGRHVVDAALARGDDVTVFHRGRHPAPRPGDVEEVLGDRDRPDDLAALRGRSWDAVVDTCGYRPRQVALAVDAVGSATGHYTYVSTGSVYADPSAPPLTEDSPVAEPPEDEDAVTVADAYGALKVGCERTVVAALRDRALVLRAGLIVGPHDPTDRLTSWVRRMDAGGEVLAPAVPDQPVQWIDARDLATWTVTAAEAGTAGVTNAVGRSGELSFAGLLATCAELAGRDADVTWVDERFLLDAGVEPWSELAMWIPAASGHLGMLGMDDTRARTMGLHTRPARETLADLLAWDRTRDRSAPLAAGLAGEREAELLAAWHDHRASAGGS